MRTALLVGALVTAAAVASAQQAAGPAQYSRAWYQQFSNTYSEPIEPFKIGRAHV